jgi:hypothetical protein
VASEQSDRLNRDDWEKSIKEAKVRIGLYSHLRRRRRRRRKRLECEYNHFLLSNVEVLHVWSFTSEAKGRQIRRMFDTIQFRMFCSLASYQKT